MSIDYNGRGGKYGDNQDNYKGKSSPSPDSSSTFIKAISPEEKEVEDYFRLIKKLVGKCEYIPAVLLTDEDYRE